jgi:signal transduction histidine kinase
MLGFIIVSNREKFYVLIFYTTVKTTLYFIQLHYPEIIVHYSSEKARWLDVLLTSIYSSVIIYLIISFIQRSYHNEREKVEKASSEMASLNEKLEESNAAKDLLLSIISHDLRSPFSAMMGLSQVLVNNAEKADREKIKEYAKAINSSAVETYFLLDNLLKWAGLQKEGIFPKKEPADLSSLTDEIISLYKDHAAQKNIEIKNSISKPVNAFCDVELTKTILRNLLTNAIKFTNPGGKIEILAEETNNHLEIKVSDTGVGITEDKMKELFSLKKTSPERGTKNEKGTGLGLNLCKVLIEAQGGQLWVRSELDKGSDFYFTLEKHN